MAFYGSIENMPCKCVKVIQKGESFNIIIYKDKLTILDSKTWTLNIDLKDDKTQSF